MSEIKHPIVLYDTLEKMSNEIIAKHLNIVVVSGVRLLKENYNREFLEFEFLQRRSIKSKSPNILAFLIDQEEYVEEENITMRVKAIVTPEGAIKAFGLDKGFVDNLIIKGSLLKHDERLGIMQPIEIINTPDGGKKIKIICNETTDKQILTNVNYHILKGKKRNNSEAENIVDENGNIIYRWFTLGISEQEDLLVPNKINVSNHVSKIKIIKPNDFIDSCSQYESSLIKYDNIYHTDIDNDLKMILKFSKTGHVSKTVINNKHFKLNSIQELSIYLENKLINDPEKNLNDDLGLYFIENNQIKIYFAALYEYFGDLDEPPFQHLGLYGLIDNELLKLTLVKKWYNQDQKKSMIDIVKENLIFKEFK